MLRSIPSLQVSPTALLVLNRIHGEVVSRSDVARATGLHPATITRAVRELLRAGLVVEAGAGASRGGRKSVLLKANPQFGHAVGVEVGSYTTKIGLCDFAGQVVSFRSLRSRTITPADLPNLIVETVSEYGNPPILGVGVGVSGVVHGEDGCTALCPNLKGWDNLPLQDNLMAALGVPVFVDTSARALAQAEAWFGCGRGHADMIYIAIGQSIGAGILTGGRVFRGTTGYAGELGHVTADESAGLCTCGNVGCLENVATLSMITGRVARNLLESPTYSPLRHRLATQVPPDLDPAEAKHRLAKMMQAEPQLVQDSACAGDKVVLSALYEVAQTLGQAVANMANLFSPRLVVLGGGVVYAIPILVDEVVRVVRERTLGPIQQRLVIKVSMLGANGPVMGGATLALERFLRRDLYVPGAPPVSLTV